MRAMIVPLRDARYGGRPRTLSHFALGQGEDYLNTDYLSAPAPSIQDLSRSMWPRLRDRAFRLHAGERDRADRPGNFHGRESHFRIGYAFRRP